MTLAAPGQNVTLGVARNLLLFSNAIELSEKCDKGHLLQREEVAEVSSDYSAGRVHAERRPRA